MALVLTTNLSLGTWTDGENPGAGSQTVDNTGLNGNWLKLDAAVGTEHNANGTHKDDKIAGASIKAAFADGSTLEMSAATSTKTIRVKDDGVTGAKLNANVVDDSTLEVSAATGTKTLRIKDSGVTQAKMAVKEYAAMLEQASTDAPSATVLSNTLGGTVVWARTGTGTYTATLSGVFTSSKTLILVSLEDCGGHVGAYWTTSSIITVLTTNSSDAAADDILGTNSSILIRVYP